jgi:hypothetical protein
VVDFGILRDDLGDLVEFKGVVLEPVRDEAPDVTRGQERERSRLPSVAALALEDRRDCPPKLPPQPLEILADVPA